MTGSRRSAVETIRRIVLDAEHEYRLMEDPRERQVYIVNRIMEELRVYFPGERILEAVQDAL